MFAKHFLAILLSGSLVLAAAPAGFADQTSQVGSSSRAFGRASHAGIAGSRPFGGFHGGSFHGGGGRR